MEQVESLAYSVNGICIALNLSKQSVYDEINSGRLRSFKAHGRRLISRKAADDYINALEAETIAVEQVGAS